jgi:mRNA interferase HigB
MNVISRPTIRAAQQRHPDARDWLDAWWRIAKAARWQSLHDVRQTYPQTDQVGQCLVFDARGNKYRLIVGVLYATEDKGGTLFVKHFLTHAEYDKDTWKEDC